MEVDTITEAETWTSFDYWITIVNKSATATAKPKKGIILTDDMHWNDLSPEIGVTKGQTIERM